MSIYSFPLSPFKTIRAFGTMSSKILRIRHESNVVLMHRSMEASSAPMLLYLITLSELSYELFLPNKSSTATSDLLYDKANRRSFLTLKASVILNTEENERSKEQVLVQNRSWSGISTS